ncbi:MAG: hypothetical protein BWK76_04815 [Desulfobulbaceae bacterium A2]|nr:MAG: hypothetical protein BWK76_04815 [Desulfobulbaceae bacterium A2]
MLFISLALNVTLGAMLAGRLAAPRVLPAKLAFDRLERLPEKERALAREVFKKVRPQLRREVQDLKKTRQATFDYIASEGYTRAEAENRLIELRRKTTKVQETSQKLMLDIAERLPPEQRALFVRRPKTETP